MCFVDSSLDKSISIFSSFFINISKLFFLVSSLLFNVILQLLYCISTFICSFFNFARVFFHNDNSVMSFNSILFDDSNIFLFISISGFIFMYFALAKSINITIIAIKIILINLCLLRFFNILISP